MTAQPTLTTERLLLRPYTEADAPDVQRLAGEREIAATTIRIPHPYPDGAAEEWISGHPRAFESRESVVFAVTLRDGGALAGGIGLDLSPAHHCGELGYWIAVPYWKRGLATEASRAVIDYGFRDLDLHRIEAHCFISNPASGRVLEKVGMTAEGELRERVLKWGDYETLRYYSILHNEWSP
ncbi:MAG: GNAT family N-acetyltransferase [Planctomycetes bacterium]|nr:GNAT family N-acetyltransferase [Planctomycetota bacterium]